MSRHNHHARSAQEAEAVPVSTAHHSTVVKPPRRLEARNRTERYHHPSIRTLQLHLLHHPDSALLLCLYR